ncbi:MAG TPA: penicillin-binding protein activator [Rhizomicrobium sp.]|nr:penicillin-binding protein activator [Rhizomicrobium sp.]
MAARVCAIAALVASASLSGCVTAPPKAPPPPPAAVQTGPITPSTHPLTSDQPDFLRLPNTPAGTPVRVGILLPFSNGSAATRALAQSMLKAAELALFDAKNPNIILVSADEGGTPDAAAQGARNLLAQGAEIIIGPLFAQSVNAVAPIARDRAVPVISFSTDRSVAGDGVYLLSFQPENEVKRVVDFAAAQGRMNFAALVPQSTYGDRVAKAFQDEVTARGGKITDIEHFAATPDGIAGPAKAAAASNPDAILIAQGGALLRGAAPGLAASGVDGNKIRLLGTGLWDDPANAKETALSGSWFAAPSPAADEAFGAKYHAAFAASPPQLATLAYDAVSLAALLAPGTPYHRFTAAALGDPNGFAGVNGIFRFNPDGTSERGLAVLGVDPNGFSTVSPAPRTFQPQGS